MFNAWQTVDADYARDCKTDSGALYFRSVQTGSEPAWCGGTFRADWLADCGLDTPVTYDDWHEMLVAFKDGKAVAKSVGYRPKAEIAAMVEGAR